MARTRPARARGRGFFTAIFEEVSVKRFIMVSFLAVQVTALGCTPESVVGGPTDVPAVDVAADGATTDTGRDAATTDTPTGDVGVDTGTTPDVPSTDVVTTDGEVTDGATTDGATTDAPSCPTGTTLCAGACVDTSSSMANCGACGTACAPAGAVGACVMGACTVASCNAGRADCNGMAADGCEADLNASATDCGRCGNACTFAHAGGACTMGTCGVGTCNTGFGDCDADQSNGCETDLAATVTACGACGTSCTLAHATAGCAASACTVASCSAGFGNCDSMAANGCETALNTNANCGACGSACAAGTRCSNGMCVSSCPTGTTFCPDLQICVNTSSDLSNCGACGNACPSPANSAGTCSGGACGITCTAGFGNCDAMAANGCETNLNTTASACGACGHACALPHATAGCAAGTCTVARCDTGFGDCDGNPANGCETDLNTTVGACGTCGNTCNVPNATAACAAGACVVASCNAGSADCNAMAADGCETPTTSNTNCGACGVVCAAGTRCAGGTCQSSCPAGTTYCAASGVCADFQTDATNCGMCGTVCPALSNASASCRAGACGFTCNTGFADCDGNAANGCEANLGTSVTACGACGRACAPAHATGACTTGACGIVACEVGYGDCNGDPSDGCEVNLTSTVSACGTCNTSCRPANGTGVCAAGRCGVATCDVGFGNCDGNVANGCETPLDTNSHCGACGTACTTGSFCSDGTCVAACSSPTSYCAGTQTCNDLSTDTLNCGACGRTCAVPANASSTCASSACGFSCNGSYANCDNNAGNGCEVDLGASVANCGTCGAACSLANATPTCTGGACAVATCNPNFGNCDGLASNGCEVNTTTSVANCGACGSACALPNATPVCTAGACAIGSCSAGFGNCNGRTSDGCETPTTTNTNCGACGTRCAAGTFCSAGACVSSCPTGTTYCSATGSCINLQTNPDNCGRCGNVCASAPHVIRTCMVGTCGGSCESGYGNCDGNAGNGCETSLTTSLTNCGACNNVCRLANATPVCAAGACAIGACYPGFANCNGTTSDGCEASLQSDTRNCGACGRACGTGQVCRFGSCR
jgi:hypothetical protein